jgi:hypothetical protein
MTTGRVFGNALGSSLTAFAPTPTPVGSARPYSPPAISDDSAAMVAAADDARSQALNQMGADFQRAAAEDARSQALNQMGADYQRASDDTPNLPQNQDEQDALSGGHYRSDSGPMVAHGFSSLSSLANLMDPGATGKAYLQDIGSIAAANGMTTSRFSADAGMIIPSAGQYGDQSALGLAIMNQDNVAAAARLAAAQSAFEAGRAQANAKYMQAVLNGENMIPGGDPQTMSALRNQVVSQLIAQGGGMGQPMLPSAFQANPNPDIPQMSAITDEMVAAQQVAAERNSPANWPGISKAVYVGTYMLLGMGGPVAGA